MPQVIAFNALSSKDDWLHINNRPSTAQCLQACLDQPGSPVIHLIDEQGNAQRLSFQQLGKRALEFLGRLQEAGLGPGALLVIRSHSRMDVITCLWACILGNITAIPIEAGIAEGPTRERLHRHLLNLLIGHPRLHVLDTFAARQLSGWNERLRADQWIQLDRQQAGGAAEAVVHPALHSDPRLLLLTSGTTGQASLVELSDRAVASRWWPKGGSCQDKTRFLSWAPLDHAMGLSACSPNANCKVIMHAMGFLRDPTCWLKLASFYRITHATMTSFGMKVILDAATQMPATQLKKLDLSCLEVIGIGAEPLDRDVFLGFSETMAGLGVHDGAYIQSYGLTECGPVISGGINRHALAQGESSSLSFNQLNNEHALRIRPGESRTASEQTGIGEIEVKGSSMASSYFADREASQQLLTEDGWIRTGDIGKIVGKKLYLIGRIKETLILNATKYPCHLVEDIAKQIPQVSEAYAIQLDPAQPGNEANHFVIVITLIPNLVVKPELAEIVLKEVGSGFGMRPQRVVIFPQGRIPRTSLGKVSRRALADQVAEGLSKDAEGIQVFAASLKASPGLEDISALEAKLLGIWEEVLEHSEFGITDNFFAVGGNSLSAVRLLTRIEQTIGWAPSLTVVFQNPTIAGLSSLMESSGGWSLQKMQDNIIPAARPIQLELP